MKEQITAPKSYQDLKKNLTIWLTLILAFSFLLFFFFILPDSHKQAITGVIGSPLANFGILLAICAGVASSLVFLLDFHQNIYDRYCIKWRRNYELDFIIPRFVQPFGNRLDANFFRVAEENLEEFMDVFWFFVGDYEKDKIRENLKVRFYEEATRYWVTQYLEIVLIAFEIALFIYYWVYRFKALPVGPILIAQFIVFGCFIINRFLVKAMRSKLRRKTLGQIQEIHERFKDRLGEELARLHKQHSLLFRPY